VSFDSFLDTFCEQDMVPFAFQRKLKGPEILQIVIDEQHSGHGA
jgi:hypothetical protein